MAKFVEEKNYAPEIFRLKLLNESAESPNVTTLVDWCRSEDTICGKMHKNNEKNAYTNENWIERLLKCFNHKHMPIQ